MTMEHSIVDILIVKDDKFLLVKEGRADRNGLFNLPGGHVDDHETLFDTAVREAKEETGFDIELTGVVGIYQAIFEKFNFSGPVFSAKVIGGEATPTKEHPEVKWVTADELYTMAKEGKLLTKYPPFAVNHYLTRGAFSLDLVTSHDYTK